MAAIGAIRGNAQNVQTQIANLEQDSLSADPNLNTEVSVLNKINAAGVLTLRTLQDSNKLLASLLEQQTIIAKQQREATTNAINTDISRRATLPETWLKSTARRRVSTELSDALEGTAHTRRVEGATTMDYLQFIFQAINNLLTHNLGFFDAMGQNLFRSFATILVVWYGVKSALSAAGGRHMFNFDNFASLLLTIAFGFAMVNYYSTPIPGMGASFHNLITDESQFLANKINQTQLQVVARELRISRHAWILPHRGHLGTIIYVVIIILLAAAQAIAIVVIAFGFIATAVCVLVGPDFIPFLSSRNWSGSFGAGSDVSSSTLSTRSLRRRSCSLLET